MKEPFKASLVRIISKDDAIAGVGFLVTERCVLTCAHVIAQALNVPPETAEAPSDEVRLDFPLLAPGEIFVARTLLWRPVSPGASSGHSETDDIAVLELTTDPPRGSQVARLVVSEDLWDHAFRSFGFPPGYDNGVYADGVMRAAQVGGWVQIEGVKDTGYFVSPGFSGSPVWDDQLDGVVGMVVGSERRPEVRAAFMIPTSALAKAWPDLDRRTIPPCPYRGLFAFREQDAAFFFGRTAFVDRLMEVVRKKPLVAVIGRSGSGKSSVVFAGLVPQLRHEGGWLIVSFRPGSSPFPALAAALLPLLDPQKSEVDRLVDIPKLADALRGGSVTLQSVVGRILEKDRTAERLLLIADQFEELYTLCSSGPERERFLDVLLAAVVTPSSGAMAPLRLVLTLRADFVSHALAYRPFADALQDADVKLGPMIRQELQEAIEGPAARLHVTIEDGLTERILDAVQEAPGNLPLLEFALAQLWPKQSNSRLTHAAYDEIGGVGEALAKYAEDKFDGLRTDDQARMQRILLQSVRPGEGHEDTRRRATRSEIGEENWGLVPRLADMRLVVSGRDESSGEETVEIVHEALIREWGRLHQWTEVDRAFRAWQERLRAAMQQWRASGQDEGALLHGSLRAEAEDWLGKRQADLSPGEQEYIQASVLLRKKEKAAARLTHGLIVILILGVVSFVAYLYRDWAQKQPWGYLRNLITTAEAAYPMKGDLISIGRSENGFHDNIDLRSRWVSRIHLFVTHAEPRAIDMRSTNGTTVNASFLPYGDSRKLEDGDVIVLAGVAPLKFSKRSVGVIERPSSAWGILVDGRSRAYVYLTAPMYSLSLNEQSRISLHSDELGQTNLPMIRRTGNNITIERHDAGTELSVQWKKNDYEYPQETLPSGMPFSLDCPETQEGPPCYPIGSFTFSYKGSPFQIVSILQE